MLLFLDDEEKISDIHIAQLKHIQPKTEWIWKIQHFNLFKKWKIMKKKRRKQNESIDVGVWMLYKQKNQRARETEYHQIQWLAKHHYCRMKWRITRERDFVSVNRFVWKPQVSNSVTHSDGRSLALVDHMDGSVSMRRRWRARARQRDEKDYKIVQQIRFSRSSALTW